MKDSERPACATATQFASRAAIACTLASTCELPQALVLAQSFQRHHPQSHFFICVTDAFAFTGDSRPNVTFLSLEELNLSAEDAHRLPKLYAAAELRLAVKPWLLRTLVCSGTSRVLYFDPDTEVFDNLEDVIDTAHSADAAFAPRNTAGGEFTRDPGFMAVGGKAAALLDWWIAELAAHFDSARSINTALLDCIPSTFGTEWLRAPGYNVGYWNVSDRDLRKTGDHYEVAGERLRFFRLAGYDPRQPHLLTTHESDTPPVLLSSIPALRELCDSYRAQLIAACSELDGALQFGVLPSGQKIDRYMFRLHRQAVQRWRQQQGPEPHDPCRPGGESAFWKWLNQRANDSQPEITRYMLAIHAARPDLQSAFPEPLGRDATAFHRWFVTNGRHEENVPPQLVPDGAEQEPMRSHSPPADLPRVSVTGYFRAELGLGESARLLVSAIRAAGIACRTVTSTDTENRQNHAFDDCTTSDSPADISIICINANELPAFANNNAHAASSAPHRIGVWFWEADEFPAELHRAFDYVDEVWVASEFVRQALAKVSPKPVWKFHHPVAAPEFDPALSRRDVGLPDRFVFLFSFDFLSVLERKNPIGLIDAFRRAFAPGEGPALVIKTINGEKRVLEMEKLKYAIGDHPDITLMDGYMLAQEKNALTALCDCYVSLHRSEGFGLTMAEAMALAKPVIGTRFSGNLAFMTDANSYLCDYRLAEVGPHREPYPADARWAEPDLKHAADLFRQVYDHPEEARARGQRAARDIAELHSPAVAGRTIVARLNRIHQLRHAPPELQRRARLEERLETIQSAEQALVAALAAELPAG